MSFFNLQWRVDQERVTSGPFTIERTGNVWTVSAHGVPFATALDPKQAVRLATENAQAAILFGSRPIKDPLPQTGVIPAPAPYEEMDP